MPPKQQRQIPATAEVVDLDNSDEECCGPPPAAGVSRINNTASKPSNVAKLQNKPPTTQPSSAPNSGDASVVNYRSLDNRSFWKAGAYEVAPTTSTLFQGDLEHARVNPKFLHSNATSHKWAFGAIAELLDNAVDEIGNGASFINVDRIINTTDNSPALLFQDDGGGMDPECMRKCMSLGYSSKTSNTTIGQYGNGFKTSTMRLGADVIVFSRANQNGRATQSVGLLSYTFLRRTRQDDVIVPMIDFNISDNWAEPIVYSSKDDWSSNLKIILDWSPFASKDDLMLQFENIGSHGTRIIIYNLWMNDEGIYELNFDDDDEDIMLRDEASQGIATKTTKKVLEQQSHLSYRIRFSLRAYASILYLKKFANFRIMLRGKPVEQFNIVDDLKHSKKVMYSPQVGMGLKEALPAFEDLYGICANWVTPSQPFYKIRLLLSVIVPVNLYHLLQPCHPPENPCLAVYPRSAPALSSDARVCRSYASMMVTVETIIGFIKEAPALNISGFNVYHKNRLIRPYWKVTGDGSSKGNGVVGVLEANFIEPAHDKQDFERSTLFIKLESRLRQMVMDYWKVNCHLIGYQPDFMRKRFVQPAALQPTTGPEAGLYPGTPLDAASLDRMCEENTQLFMRCEEYKKQQDEMTRTVEELEKELGETRNKCARLSSRLETQRKETLTPRPL